MSNTQDDKLLSAIMHEIFGGRCLQDPRNRFLLVKIKDSDEIGFIIASNSQDQTQVLVVLTSIKEVSDNVEIRCEMRSNLEPQKRSDWGRQITDLPQLKVTLKTAAFYDPTEFNPLFVRVYFEEQRKRRTYGMFGSCLGMFSRCQSSG